MIEFRQIIMESLKPMLSGLLINAQFANFNQPTRVNRLLNQFAHADVLTEFKSISWTSGARQMVNISGSYKSRIHFPTISGYMHL